MGRSWTISWRSAADARDRGARAAVRRARDRRRPARDGEQRGARVGRAWDDRGRSRGAPRRRLGIAALALLFAALGIVVARRVTVSSEERAWAAHGTIVDDLVALLGGRLELVANGRDASFRAETRARLARWRDLALRSERLGALAGRAPVLAGALGVV